MWNIVTPSPFILLPSRERRSVLHTSFICEDIDNYSSCPFKES